MSSYFGHIDVSLYLADKKWMKKNTLGFVTHWALLFDLKQSVFIKSSKIRINLNKGNMTFLFLVV